MARGIQPGDTAPDFTLPSQSGVSVQLYDRLRVGAVVLYFYPKDETRGCTAQACAFRDSHEVFTDAGAEVIGVSSDSVGKHAAFAARHDLPFTLVSDETGQVRKDYGVPTVLGIIPGRAGGVNAFFLATDVAMPAILSATTDNAPGVEAA